jgi:phosphotransferase system enzyme I (PtsP)
MNNHNLPKVKWIIRNIHRGDAEQLLAKVLTLNNPQDVRQEINQYLESVGLGGLVRAGI